MAATNWKNVSKPLIIALAAILLGFALPRAGQTQPTPLPGEAIYNSHCAACHDHPETSRAPPKSTLGQMPAATIDYALTEGKMKAMGAGLSEAERGQLIGYLTGGKAPVAAQDADHHLRL